MDLGLGLDDDIFDSCRERIKQPYMEPYTARQCPPLWFNDVDASLACGVDDQTIMKYRGDVAYHEEQYEVALGFYQQCLDLLQPNNFAMRRGVEEDKSRCQLRLGLVDEALDTARNVAAMAQNFEQVTSVLELFLDIFMSARDTKEILRTLKQLLLLHPSNSSIWLRLGIVYYSSSTTETLLPTGVNLQSSLKSEAYPLSHDADQKSQLASRNKSELDESNCKKLENNCADTVCDHKLDGCAVPESASGFYHNVNGQIRNTASTSPENIQENHCTVVHSSDDENDRVLDVEKNRFVACLTCFMAARLLLQSTYTRLNSFPKIKNNREQLEVESLIDKLVIHPGATELLTRCSSFLKVALNLTETIDELNSPDVYNSNEIAPSQILCEEEKMSALFDKKWFLWPTA